MNVQIFKTNQPDRINISFKKSQNEVTVLKNVKIYGNQTLFEKICAKVACAMNYASIISDEGEEYVVNRRSLGKAYCSAEEQSSAEKSSISVSVPTALTPINEKTKDAYANIFFEQYKNQLLEKQLCEERSKSDSSLPLISYLDSVLVSEPPMDLLGQKEECFKALDNTIKKGLQSDYKNSIINFDRELRGKDIDAEQDSGVNLLFKKCSKLIDLLSDSRDIKSYTSINDYFKNELSIEQKKEILLELQTILIKIEF